ncbi:hypothetical protein WJX79_005501 [Trebouxia sp. C0005]
MAEVCNDPVHCNAAGSSAPLSGTDLIPEEKKSIKQKKKRTRSASQIVLDSQGINNRPGPQSLQADPQPEHRVLAEGSTEAAKQAASGDAPKRKKRKVGAPTAQQGDLQPSITAPDLPKEPQDSAWEDSFLSRGYIDKCESWLAEAVQGRADAKSVAVHIMVLAHYWEYQVLLHVSNHDSQTASLQQISKIQFRIRGLAKQLQDLLPPSWMPAVAVTAGRLLRGMSLICPVWMRLSSKTALVNGTFQLLHPEDLPHDCATQTVSYLLEALHPAPNDQRFATYLACWSDKTHEAAAAEEPPRDAMASSSSPQMHGRQTQGRELTAQQASAAVELPAANQAAALVEVRTATDAAEASCLNLEEPGLAQPEKVKTGPTSGVAPAKARGKTGTAFPIVQAAPTLSSGQAAIAGTCELPAAAAQAQLSGKPELADSFDLGKSDATAKAMPAQMTNILVQVVPASQGNMLVGQAEGQLAPGQTSLHGQSTLPIAKSVQKPPLAPKFGQRRKQVPDQQRPEQTAAQLNAYLRLDDNGLAYAAAILSKVAPPPYDAAEPWLRRTNKETGVRHAAQVCKAYLRMLHKMYGDELVMQPYIMSVDALNARDTSGAEALSNFRLLQKRFVVYQPSKAAPHPPSTPGQPQSGPEQIMKTSSCHQPGQDQQAARDGSDSIDVDIMGMQEQDDADSQSALLDWDDALVRLWKKAQQRVGPLTHGEVRDQLDPAAPSCGLQAGTWQAGRCMSEEVGDTVRVQDAIDNSLLNKPQGFPRLHFIDGTFPGELPEGVTCQDDLPGLWCGVDQTANQMFPPALRSDRPDSFFKQMCVESTGDFIVQPLCTADNVRQVERVHAAVMGAHERHACLLPLEMYLEEGIPLVCYIRDQGHAQMVELPEQSCHAFMSFSNAAAPPPCIKVSCNDWHVESELSSAYLLEKLLASCREAGVEAEVGEGGADPDTWVETPYALRQPCSLHEQTGEPMCKLGLDGTWQRPWADEMQTQECTEQDVAEQADRGNRCSDVEVLLVRCMEREIDHLDGKLKDTAWNALVTTSQSLRVLQNALPVLLDMAIRAEPVSSDQASYFSKEYMHRLIYLVQKALSSAGLDTALHKAEAFLADLHATKGSKGSKEVGAGNGGSAEDRHTSHMSSEVRRMVKSDQVFGVFMHLQDAVDCKVSCSTTASRKKTAIAGLRHFTEAVEALTQTELLGLSLPTLRAHWLLAMHRELQAAQVVNNRLDFGRLNKVRRHRCCLEELHDHRCQKLVQRHTEEWGVADYRA